MCVLRGGGVVCKVDEGECIEREGWSVLKVGKGEY